MEDPPKSRWKIKDPGSKSSIWAEFAYSFAQATVGVDEAEKKKKKRDSVRGRADSTSSSSGIPQEDPPPVWMQLIQELMNDENLDSKTKLALTKVVSAFKKELNRKDNRIDILQVQLLQAQEELKQLQVR